MTTDSRLMRLWHFLKAHHRQLLLLFVAVLAPLLLFGWLAEDVLEHQAFRFDDPLLLYVHHFATPGLDRFMLWMSLLGYQVGVVPADLVISLWLLLRRHLRAALFFILAVGGAGLLNQLAKSLFGRERPKLWPSLAPEATFSFPSGHAMGSMALVTALVILLWSTRWRYPILVLGSLFVLLVGFSRLYLGVHYPSDVLAGWVASLAWVMGLSYVLYGMPLADRQNHHSGVERSAQKAEKLTH